MEKVKTDIVRGVLPSMKLPSLTPSSPHEASFINLMSACWQRDPKKRPRFLDIVTCLHQICRAAEIPRLAGQGGAAGALSATLGLSGGSGKLAIWSGKAIEEATLRESGESKCENLQGEFIHYIVPPSRSTRREVRCSQYDTRTGMRLFT